MDELAAPSAAPSGDRASDLLQSVGLVVRHCSELLDNALLVANHHPDPLFSSRFSAILEKSGAELPVSSCSRISALERAIGNAFIGHLRSSGYTLAVLKPAGVASKSESKMVSDSLEHVPAPVSEHVECVSLPVKSTCPDIARVASLAVWSDVADAVGNIADKAAGDARKKKPQNVVTWAVDAHQEPTKQGFTNAVHDLLVRNGKPAVTQRPAQLSQDQSNGKGGRKYDKNKKKPTNAAAGGESKNVYISNELFEAMTKDGLDSVMPAELVLSLETLDPARAKAYKRVAMLSVTCLARFCIANGVCTDPSIAASMGKDLIATLLNVLQPGWGDIAAGGLATVSTKSQCKVAQCLMEATLTNCGEQPVALKQTFVEAYVARYVDWVKRAGLTSAPIEHALLPYFLGYLKICTCEKWVVTETQVYTIPSSHWPERKFSDKITLEQLDPNVQDWDGCLVEFSHKRKGRNICECLGVINREFGAFGLQMPDMRSFVEIIECGGRAGPAPRVDDVNIM